jgi:phage tail tube protein FII
VYSALAGACTWIIREDGGKCKDGATTKGGVRRMVEQKPLRVNIRVERRESPLGEMLTGENAETRLETAWKAMEEVKRVHPNAEISIEVEV